MALMPISSSDARRALAEICMVMEAENNTNPGKHKEETNSGTKASPERPTGVRTLKIRDVQCQSCGTALPRRSYGSDCAACGDGFFRVTVERHSFGLDSDAILESFLDDPI